MILPLKKIIDSRGSMFALNSLPFEVKRVFILKDIKQTRGNHAHKKLREVLICLSGYCTISLDNGISISVVKLTSPEQGLLIEPELWRTISECSTDCTIVSLCSHELDQEDYIRTYNEFKRFINNER